MMKKEIIIAGFGGQGILFTGKLLAYTGMKNDRTVSWLPSYGPEMRGGTANCSVIISDDMIGSPLVTEATEAIVMNSPSFEKFENTIIPGGSLFYDSTLISNPHKRADINYIPVEATKIAADMNIRTLANMVITGRVIKETGIFTFEQIFESLKSLTPKSKPELYELNKKAIEVEGLK
jgi:2-oxoglutarate ferredoxin oxidoreductase subunit gamma